jgi:hypothetical protein
LFPWLIRGADFDNDSAFMNDVVVPWCREQKIEVTRSRAYKKNDQAFVEQKNGAVVRRLVGYARFDGVETARVMARLYAAARLHVNFFQPSFKLREKRREGAKVIKRYHPPATPYERALAHPKLSKAIKRRLRETYRSLDPVALLAEIRAAQDELGERIGKRGLAAAAVPFPVDPLVFARSLGTTAKTAEVRATHRRPKRRYKKRIRMPSKLDPHLTTIESWLATEPQITALAIVRRLAAIDVCAAIVTITVSVALRRNDRSRRCTIECCSSLKVAGSIAASRRTMARAAICGSVASQLSIVVRCGSSLEGMRIRFL